jgi:Ca-activated chloride channel family protein
MFELQWPFIFLLLPLPLVVRWLSKAQSNAVGAALRVPFFAQLRSLSGEQNSPVVNGNKFHLLLMSLLWIALLAASARPIWIGDAVAMPTNGRDLMLAVDISGSMSQEDMIIQDEALPRLTVVKAVVNQFVEQRRGDKLGLILFGSQPYIQSPLTFDLDTVNTLMNEAQVGFAGKQTAIGDAIGFAIKRLRDRPENSRVVVLLTDGADTASSLSPLEASKLAASEQIKIYTIGVGATEMRVPGVFGSSFGARTVNPSADLDEGSLQSIADNTGGAYYRARNPSELQAAYAAIAALEPVEQEQEMLRPERSLLHWPLLTAAGLWLILALSRNLPSLPRQATRPASKKGEAQ